MRSNSDLTLYQRSVVAGAEAWTRVQVLGVHWEDSDGAKVLPNGTIRDDKATVYVPYARRPVTEFTEGDVIVRGLVADAITTGFTISDLKRKYRDVLTVRRVTRRDFGSLAMRHWEIAAS
jgi:hypothetical protein